MVRRRLDLGHDSIGAEIDGAVVCAANYVLVADDPRDAHQFPLTFGEFSTLPRSEPVQSAYVYSLCVHPDWRGGPSVFRVIDSVLTTSRIAGATFVVGDGRCPSYNGSAADGPDRVEHSAEFQATIEEWKKSGIQPSDESLMVDPVLRFYKRYTNCQFLYLKPDFVPYDEASGGYRVIFAVDVTDRIS